MKSDTPKIIQWLEKDGRWLPLMIVFGSAMYIAGGVGGTTTPAGTCVAWNDTTTPVDYSDVVTRNSTEITTMCRDFGFDHCFASFTDDEAILTTMDMDSIKVRPIVGNFEYENNNIGKIEVQGEPDLAVASCQAGELNPQCDLSKNAVVNTVWNECVEWEN